MTKKTGKLSVFKKLTVGVGGTADNMMQNSVNMMSNQVLNIYLGMNPALISLAIFIARIWDAFSDPIMGAVSDNTRTRFGRRRPYILMGGILGAVFFVLLWRFPAGMSELGYFWWFLIGSLIFYTCYTIYIVPFNALSYALTSDYNERTSVMVFKSFFGGAAGVIMAWIYKITQLDCFENTLEGMQAISWVLAVIFIIVTAIPAIFLKEPDEKKIKRQEKVSIVLSLKETLQVPEFRRLLTTVILICLGVFMVNQLGMYIVIYHMFECDQKAASIFMGIAGTMYATFSIFSSPVIGFVSARLGKKETLVWGLSLGSIGAFAKIFTYNQDHPWLMFISLALMAPGLSCLWVLTTSMVADICDLDELKTHTRREGMFGAVYGYVMKIGVSLGLLMTGFILNATGFDAKLGVDQPEHTILTLRLLFAVIPGASLLIGAFIFSQYSLGAERSRDIRRQLEEREVHRELDVSEK